ncbi:MAG: hypothetical protein ACREC9_15680 [Methylocella sp.]
MTSAPPLLVLAAGGRPRLRRERIVPAKESKLQIQVAEVLRDHLLPDWLCTHFPAGESRGRGLDAIITGTRLKRYGLHPGWPDQQLISPVGLYHGLELKRDGEELTDDQKAFMAWALDRNVPYVAAWTIDQALAALDRWGCLRIKIYPRGAAGG